MNQKAKRTLGFSLVLLGVFAGGLYKFSQGVSSLVEEHNQELSNSSTKESNVKSYNSDYIDLEAHLTITPDGGIVFWRDINGDRVFERYYVNDEGFISFEDNDPPHFVMNDIETSIKEAHNFETLKIQ